MLAVRRRVEDPIPKRDIYSMMYILFFDRKNVQYVSKHCHFTMVWYVKGISAKNLASISAISVFFAIIHQQQKTRFLHVHLSARPCSEKSMSLFRNDIYWQNDIFSIILIHEDNKVYQVFVLNRQIITD